MSENVEELEKKFEVKKKNNKVKIIAIVILILLLIFCGLFAFYKITSNPKYILKSLVNKINFEDTNSKIETLKADYELSFDIKTSNKQVQLGFNEISKCVLKTSVQTDFNKRNEIINLGLIYDDQEVIGSKVVLNNETVYAFLNGIYDKYIKLELDNKTKETVNSIFDAYSKNNDKEETEEVIKIIKASLIEEIEKSETVTQDKIEISVNDKDKKVLKTSIKLSTKDMTNILSNLVTKLSESQIYENKEEDKKSLEDLAKEMKQTEINTNDYAILSIYTCGIKNDFVGLKFTFYIEESNMNVNFELIENSNDSYKYTLSSDGQGSFVKIAEGEIKYKKEINNNQEKKGDFSISIEVPEIITQAASINATISVKYNVKINSKIDDVDTSNNILLDNLTDKDYEQMLEKLKQKPLIGPIISSIIQMNMQSEEFDFDVDDTLDKDGLVFNNYDF